MKIKVVYKNLGKKRVHGLAYCKHNVIELDSRLKGRKHLEILIHEAWHVLHPNLPEDSVVKDSVVLTNLLWEQGYRRIDNDANDELQDGSK